jgi:DNA-binding transcriptional LysR family regulator
VTPTLTARLAEGMSQCAFRLQTGPSHELAARIGARDLDIAICAAPATDPPGTVSHLLVRDPYILAVPRGISTEGGLAGLSHMPFLRRDMDQLMGQQIEAHLVRDGPAPAAQVRDGLQSIDQRACRLGHRLDDHDPAQPVAGGAFRGRHRCASASRRPVGTADRAVRDR